MAIIKECMVCGKGFEAGGRSKTCSSEHSILRKRMYMASWRTKNPEKIATNYEKAYANHKRKYACDENVRARIRRNHRKYTDKNKGKIADRARKIGDLLATLRAEMPGLLKEFGL